MTEPIAREASQASKPCILRFGIPSLDELFGEVRNWPDLSGIDCTEFKSPTSVCIIGPDGTGKSVLALHLVSRYTADCHALGAEDPKILYVSTDLTHSKAADVWRNFGLDRPNLREVPFLKPPRLPGSGPLFDGVKPTLEVRLLPYVPLGPEPGEDSGNSSRTVSDYLLAKNCWDVAFVDMATTTAGDDWGFLNRLLAALPKPKGETPRHLMIIDAVEGLETLVGVHDAFGLESTRRARIAQIVKAATGKCHVLFIVEESIPNQEVPEQFVTDVVLRLRATQVRRYTRRTLEIEKARAQSHARGEHSFVIRNGMGSTTGSQENVDDPRTTNGYVHVMHSLHLRTRSIMKEKGTRYVTRTPSDKMAAFGIHYLDDMLAGVAETPELTWWKSDRCGLPYGKIAALIGDPGTEKTSLATAFLRRGFLLHAERMLSIMKELRQIGQPAPQLPVIFKTIAVTWERRLQEETRREVCNAKEMGEDGATILYRELRGKFEDEVPETPTAEGWLKRCTMDTREFAEATSNGDLARKFAEWLMKQHEDLDPSSRKEEERTLIEELETGFATPPSEGQLPYLPLLGSTLAALFHERLRTEYLFHSKSPHELARWLNKRFQNTPLLSTFLTSSPTEEWREKLLGELQNLFGENAFWDSLRHHAALGHEEVNGLTGRVLALILREQPESDLRTREMLRTQLRLRRYAKVTQ